MTALVIDFLLTPKSVSGIHIQVAPSPLIIIIIHVFMNNEDGGWNATLMRHKRGVYA